MSGLHDSLRGLARAIRSPGAVSALPARPLEVYRTLVYSGVEGFLSNGFPVLRSLFGDGEWRALVEAFIARHACHTPYFHQIGEEFVCWLADGGLALCGARPFVAELAHYERVEVTLDIDPAELPPRQPAPVDWLAHPARLSPLVRLLAYAYPVHAIHPGCQPEAPPAESTCLLVWRDRADAVRFMALTPASLGLLQQAEQGARTWGEALATLAKGWPGAEPDALAAFARGLLQSLWVEDVVLACAENLPGGGRDVASSLVMMPVITRVTVSSSASRRRPGRAASRALS